MKLNDYIVQDFSGGQVMNKADHEMNRNEFSRMVNFEIDEKGRAKTRRGYQIFGANAPASTVYGIVFQQWAPLNGVFLVFSSGSNANSYRLKTTSLTALLTRAETTADATSIAGFLSATNTLEIEGDLVTYTAIPGGGVTFTVTAATILSNHAQGRSVNQWNSAVATGVDSRCGIYAAYLNSLMLLIGRNATGATTTDGSSYTTRTVPSALFATTYHDRIFAAGDGTSGATNSNPIRVSFSNAGDPTTWTTGTDFFDVEDSLNEHITGLNVLNDNLLIFKQNSIFAYNESSLRQISVNVGAYNHYVVQEIGGVLYTFCPSGVYATTGFRSKKISESIEKILESFYPIYDSTNLRVVANCRSGKFNDKYFLFLSGGGNNLTYLPNPEDSQVSVQEERVRNLCLVYDTKKNAWSIFHFSSDVNAVFNFVVSVPSFCAGSTSLGNNDVWQGREGLFALDGTNGIMRLFDNREIGGDSSATPRGKDLTADLINNNTGVSIPAFIETAWLDFGSPNTWKKVGFLKLLIEQGDLDVLYRVDKGIQETDWKPLGNFRKGTHEQEPPDNEGERFKLRFVSNKKDIITILGGFRFGDIELISKRRKWRRK